MVHSPIKLRQFRIGPVKRQALVDLYQQRINALFNIPLPVILVFNVVRSALRFPLQAD